MNFFQSLSALQVNGGWNISIAHGAADILIVSVLLANDKCGDKAGKTIPPLVLKGTARELDEGFFAAIETPIKTTAQLLTNMEAYLKAQETAKKNSAMEKDNAVKAEKDKTEKQKKYEASMKKVDELEEEGKFREAWMKVPEISEYPEQAEILRKRREELSAQFAPDLFNA
ncbi:MAG: PRTRC system protein E [Chitinophagaceae bacterium]|jgi:PRTRC genetic system protein E